MDDTELTDDQLRQLTQLGIIPDKQKDIEKQMQIAQALRYSQAPGMSGNFGSRVQTAASPLAMIAHMAQQYKGGMQEHELRGQQSDLLNQQAQGRLMMARLLNKRRGVDPTSLPTTSQDSDPGDIQAVLPQ